MLEYVWLLLDYRLLLVFVITFLVSLAYLKACKPRANPPGPPTVPFLGNLNLLSSNPRQHVTLFELGRKYGPLYSLQLGWYPAVVISDLEMLREAFLQHGDLCSDRFNHHAMEKILSRGQDTLGVINSDGQIWKASRKLASGGLREFGMGKALLEERVASEADHLMEELTKFGGKPFKCQRLFREATANVICTMLFGNRCSKEDFNDIVESLEVFFTLGNMLSPMILLPYLIPIKMPQSKGFYQILLKLFAVIEKQIKLHRQDFDPNDITDFIDTFLEAEAQNPNDIIYSEKNCSVIVLNLLMAGTDTTGSTLAWLMLFMLRHPEIQERCRQDVLEVVGKNRRPQWKDRENLPYIEATLFETLRISNIAPHAVNHSTAGDVTLRGYTLAKNTVIIPDLYSIHMNPDVWESPQQFRPERFIDAKGKVYKPPHFIPFSIGKRTCLGEPLARVELFIFFTTMLQHFRFMCDDISKLPTLQDGTLAMTLIPPPYEVQACPI